MLAPPMMLVKTESSNSTLTPEHSDADTASSCSSALLSPRGPVPSEGACNVVVKSTFLDVEEGVGLMECFRQLRGRTMSDSAVVVTFGGEEAYIPGKFSEEHATPQEIVIEDPKDDGKAQQAETRSTHPSEEKRSTVMLRNVPNNYTRERPGSLLNKLF